MEVLSQPSVPCVVYLDDEAGNRQAFESAFRKEFKILIAATPEEMWALFKVHRVHVLICDQRMPGNPGSAVLKQVRERYPAVRRMLVTAYADLQAIVDALNQGGACFYIQKPWEIATVRQAVLKAYEEIRGEEEMLNTIERLRTANQQLDYALRQRLLS